MQFFMAIYNWLVYQIGVRGDTASSTGSLHAKIKNMADNILGTSSDDRADNTVMGFLNTQVKSWQRVTVNPSSSSAVYAALSSVDPAKCLVFVNGSQGFHCANAGAPVGIAASQRYVSAFSATSITLTLPVTAIGSYTTAWDYGLFSIIVVELY